LTTCTLAPHMFHRYVRYYPSRTLPYQPLQAIKLLLDKHIARKQLTKQLLNHTNIPSISPTPLHHSHPRCSRSFAPHTSRSAQPPRPPPSRDTRIRVSAIEIPRRPSVQKPTCRNRTHAHWRTVAPRPRHASAARYWPDIGWLGRTHPLSLRSVVHLLGDRAVRTGGGWERCRERVFVGVAWLGVLEAWLSREAVLGRWEFACGRRRPWAERE